MTLQTLSAEDDSNLLCVIRWVMQEEDDGGGVIEVHWDGVAVGSEVKDRLMLLVEGRQWASSLAQGYSTSQTIPGQHLHAAHHGWHVIVEQWAKAGVLTSTHTAAAYGTTSTTIDSAAGRFRLKRTVRGPEPNYKSFVNRPQEHIHCVHKTLGTPKQNSHNSSRHGLLIYLWFCSKIIW